MKSENLISLYAAINQLMIRMQANTNLLEQENAKLKAQLENTRLGLEKMDKMCLSLKFCIDCDHEGWWLEDKPNCNIIIEAPTLADLIDKITLKEVE